MPMLPDLKKGTNATRVLLRIEAVVAALVGLVAYAHYGIGWPFFFFTILIPDLGMLGYLKGPRFGAACYNFTHFVGWAYLSIGAGMIFEMPQVLAIGLVWLVHVGIDRALGYGLKYPEGFKMTHLSFIR